MWWGRGRRSLGSGGPFWAVLDRAQSRRKFWREANPWPPAGGSRKSPVWSGGHQVSDNSLEHSPLSLPGPGPLPPPPGTGSPEIRALQDPKVHLPHSCFEH